MKLDLATVARMQARHRSTKKRADHEHEEQAALIRWAELQAKTMPELGLLFAVPNGGKRHPVTAAKMKAEGQKAGVPDLILPVQRGGFAGLCVEMKAGKNPASAEQKWWLTQLQGQGYCCYIAYGWIAARRLITEYLAGRPVQGLIHREAV